MRRPLSILLLFAAALLVPARGLVPVLNAQAPTSGAIEQKVDQVFAKFGSATPGCAVGVSQGGRPVFEKGYGMADLEHDVPNTVETVFEAGSVSKQFTAAAVLLLAHDGKLSLDDPVRKYIPELADYGKPLLIRHILTHTSGLRDWGEVEAIAGWPRTSRVYTHSHVLDIVSRQRALNFEPGTNWSYSNTGYNLAAIIVTRVSGRPFAEFCRARIFEPLGMTHTSWRDEFRRIVKGRAIGYDQDRQAGGFLQDMPFENVHGNGGLLTTVGDLLKWNENFASPKVGDEAFVREQQQPGRFNDGHAHDYALGLYVRQYKGLSEVSHSGSTAGYRAYLTRYPVQQLSVAVLCNAGGAAAAERYAHSVADLYLGDVVKRTTANSLEPVPEILPISDPMKVHAGMYRNRATGRPLTIVLDKNEFRLDGAPGALLIPESDMRFSSQAGDRTYEFDAKGHLAVTLSNGITERYDRVEPVRPTPTQLKPYAGNYWSDDAEVAMDIVLDGRTLILTRRPDTRLTLKPLYKDAFSAAGLGVVRFRRNSQGRVVGLSVVLDRVWDMRFVRRESGRPTT